MGNVIFTIGCPGAGKTTYANMLVHNGWQKLCLDDFRVAIWGTKENFWKVALSGGVEAQNAKTTLGTIYDAAFHMLMAGDGNVIVANVHTTHGESQFQAARAKHSARIVVFSVPLIDLMKRNDARPEDDRVGEEYLRRSFDEFNSEAAWWRKYHDVTEWRRA